MVFGNIFSRSFLLVLLVCLNTACPGKSNGKNAERVNSEIAPNGTGKSIESSEEGDSERIKLNFSDEYIEYIRKFDSLTEVRATLKLSQNFNVEEIYEKLKIFLITIKESWRDPNSNDLCASIKISFFLEYIYNYYQYQSDLELMPKKELLKKELLKKYYYKL